MTTEEKICIIKSTKIELDDRVITTEFSFRGHYFAITNVYAPPYQPDRLKFLNAWSPLQKTNSINVIAGDFNLNLNLTLNRVSQTKPQRDPSREVLERKMLDFFNAAECLETSLFLTYFQN